MSHLVRAVMSGTAVCLATTAVLSARARAEGRRPVQTINATSHWYLGEGAGRSKAVDLVHTALGFATHLGASLLWSDLFARLRRSRPQGSVVGQAGAITAIAAVVDYAVVPKRLTPGWEEVVQPKSIALAYLAMALALAASTAGYPREEG